MPTSRYPGTRTEAPRATGVTLLELIVVVTILAVLFGIGLGAFRKLARPDREATAQIKQALRDGHLLARRAGTPAHIVVRPGSGEVFATGMRRVGNWHFEDEGGTGWPVPAQYPAEALDSDGVIGSALELTGDATLRIGDLPAGFSGTAGFGLDVYVAPEAGGRPMTILARPGSWRVALDRDDELEVAVLLASEAPGAPAEELRRTLGRVLVPGAWNRLAVSFDGRMLRVVVDGVPVGEDTVLPAMRRLARTPATPIDTGEPGQHFRGRLDELVVSAAVSGDRTPLPDTVELLGDERLLRLDAEGHLDPGWHDGPVELAFRYGAPSRRTVVELGLLGGVRSWTDDADGGRGPDGAEVEDEP